MIKNYLLSLYRNIVRNKFYSILNIVGLSIGIAAAIFILLYIQDELSYDKYNEKYERIYRIESDFTISGKHDHFAIVPTPMGPALQLEYPEVESFCRFYENGNTLIRAGEIEYYEDYFYFCDSTIFGNGHSRDQRIKFQMAVARLIFHDPHYLESRSISRCHGFAHTIFFTKIFLGNFFRNNNCFGLGKAGFRVALYQFISKDVENGGVTEIKIILVIFNFASTY